MLEEEDWRSHLALAWLLLFLSLPIAVATVLWVAAWCLVLWPDFKVFLSFQHVSHHIQSSSSFSKAPGQTVWPPPSPPSPPHVPPVGEGDDTDWLPTSKKHSLIRFLHPSQKAFMHLYTRMSKVQNLWREESGKKKNKKRSWHSFQSKLYAGLLFTRHLSLSPEVTENASYCGI